MKLVFATGLEEVDRKTIIDLAIQRTGRNNKFMVVDFDRLGSMPSEIKEVKNQEEVREILSRFHNEVEKIMISGLKDQKDNIIVNGFLTLSTPFGYMMAIPEDFFDSFKPDNIVILEKESDDEKTNEQQRINRFYGARYSSRCNSFLKIVKFKENRIMDAVEKLSDVIKH